MELGQKSISPEGVLPTKKKKCKNRKLCKLDSLTTAVIFICMGVEKVSGEGGLHQVVSTGAEACCEME